MAKYTLEPGRLILRDGVPVITIGHVSRAGNSPADTDDMAHEIVHTLNAAPALLEALVRLADTADDYSDTGTMLEAAINEARAAIRAAKGEGT